MCYSSFATRAPKHTRLSYLKEKFGFTCRCAVCCGDTDDQERIIEKRLSLAAESILLIDLAKKYDACLDGWRIVAVKKALILALSQKLQIGSVKSKIGNCAAAAQAAQMARDSVLLVRAMDAWKELVTRTGFESLKVEYEEMKGRVTKWAPQFDSKKLPTKEEIDAFHYYYYGF